MTERSVGPRLRDLETGALTSADIEAIRAILFEAFGTGEEAFAEDDWTHALGGRHFILDVDDRIVSHAAVVERTLFIGDAAIRSGYVEAVATAPGQERRGYGTIVMKAATAYIRETFDFGALGTGRHQFYERLGWQTWRGQAYVRISGSVVRTPDDEGYILALRTPGSPTFDGSEPIACEARVGEHW